MTLESTLQRRIRLIRRISGKTQREVAAKMGITQQGYSLLENASWRGGPQLDTLERFAKALNVHMAYLFLFDLPVERSSIDMWRYNNVQHLTAAV